MSKTISINTVQGIGDIFWVYQKLAPYFDVIDLNILCVDLGVVQTRAREFCGMLPKVGTVEFHKVSNAEYHKVAGGRFAMADVIRRAPGPVDYAVNDPLERGINLRHIDRQYPIAEFVDMGLPASVERGDYLCVYISGTNRSPSVWTPEKWVNAIRKLTGRLETTRIVLIGAKWDEPVQDVIRAALRDEFAITSQVGTMALADSIGIIRGARFFLGYQSGLNVIAENYDMPQLMVYFAKLRPMMFTWCKPASLGTRFHAMTFGDDVDAAIAALPPG